MQIRIGTSGWSYKDWEGNFYPAGVKQAGYLSHYSKVFDTVEVDSTFYSIPRQATVENWYARTPKDFKFSAKFPQKITHESGLVDIDDYLTAFLKSMESLREKLGPLLLQFPYSFKPDMSDELFRFAKKLPRGFQYVIEVRHKSWLSERFYDQLREFGIGLALLDHPWMPKPQVTTSNILYVRFMGDRKAIPEDFSHERNDRTAALGVWEKVVRALEERVSDFYGYFNNHYSGHSPTTAKRFRDMLTAK